MRWVTASDLETWAQTRIISRVELAKVVSDLVRASVADIATMRFPSGDKGQVRGFDGHLICSTAALNVPEGVSYWEFGTNKNYEDKANKDFNKRSTEASEDEQSNTTYVFVSPWTWDSSNANNKLEDWISRAKSKSKWKDVRYIDGSMLETWLDHCPAVAAWHAKETFGLRPQDGIRSTDEFWKHFAGQFGPTLTEDVLLCEREAVAQQVLSGLLEPSNTVQVIADAQDEAIAFAVAAMRKAAPEIKLFLEARTLIIDSLAAARQLVSGKPLVLLLRSDAARSPTQLADLGPLLVPLSRKQKSGGAIVLDRPGGQAMGIAMNTMGLDENRALTLARGSGRSLRALARLIPGGTYEEPPWVTDGSILLPLILAGAWDTTNDLDRAAVERVAGLSRYSELEQQARRFRDTDDPPFDLEGAIWKVRAPVDAFVCIGRLLDREQTDRLRSVMLDVFGALEADADPDAIISFTRPNPTGFSEWIREGLATTFLLIAVWGDMAGVNLGGESGQTWANRVMQDIPGLASDPRVLTSLRRELPLLAEAAPDPLLSALERMLEGGSDLVGTIFNAERGLLYPNYKHTGALWALETIAWDPTYFRRAILILAGLAAIAPEIRLANTPVRSLSEIFMLWNPNTNAQWAARLSALQEICKRFPTVGWSVVKALLPSTHGSSSPTARPKLREGGATDRPRITYRELWEHQSAIIDIAIELAGDSETKWRELIPGIRNFSPEKREQALERLDQVLHAASAADSKLLWVRLRDEVDSHERFQKAQWALKGDDLAPLKALVAKYAPDDPISPVTPLFDNYALDATVDIAASNNRRAKALREIYSRFGPSAVIRLAAEARVPFLVVEAIGGAALPASDVEILLRASFKFDPASMLTVGLSGLLRKLVGEGPARNCVIELAGDGSPEILSDLLQPWPNEPSTWTLVRQLGAELEAAYWRRRMPHYFTGTKRALLRGTRMYLRYDRAIEALQAAFNRLDEIPTRLIFEILNGIITQFNAHPTADVTMTAFYVEKALAILDARDDTGIEEISQIEFALFPLFEHGEARNLRIHQLMARSPALYHNFICNVFPGKHEDIGEPSEDERSRAQRSYSLLTTFTDIPGRDNQDIDVSALHAWVVEVRQLGETSDRAAVTDNFIGRLFAHAPHDPADGGWPHRAIREEIENAASEELERGLQLARFNMRGVHGRQLFEGGAQERGLARENAQWASIAAHWPRTAELLRSIADTWEQDAKREDTYAAQRKLRS